MRKDKNLAIGLRKQGKSYNEIAKILKAPKSTLSLWLRNIKMPLEIERKFWNKTRKKWAQSITEFNKKRAETVRQKAKKLQENAARNIGVLSKRELLLIGTALYWAEGYKKSRWALHFSNSDPVMIKFIMKFFRKICNIPKQKIKALVQIHPNVTSKVAVNYWSKITRIPKTQFSKTYSRVTPSSKHKRPPNALPYGTLRVSVYNGQITNKIKGWLSGITEKI